MRLLVAGHRLAVQPFQLRLVVERIDLAQAALQEDLDRPLGLGRMMRRRIGRCTGWAAASRAAAPPGPCRPGRWRNGRAVAACTRHRSSGGEVSSILSPNSTDGVRMTLSRPRRISSMATTEADWSSSGTFATVPRRPGCPRGFPSGCRYQRLSFLHVRVAFLVCLAHRFHATWGRRETFQTDQPSRGDELPTSLVRPDPIVWKSPTQDSQALRHVLVRWRKRPGRRRGTPRIDLEMNEQ